MKKVLLCVTIILLNVSFCYTANKSIFKDDSKVDKTGSTDTVKGGLNILGDVGVGFTTPISKLSVYDASVDRTYIFVSSHQISGYAICITTNGNVTVGQKVAPTSLIAGDRVLQVWDDNLGSEVHVKDWLESVGAIGQYGGDTYIGNFVKGTNADGGSVRFRANGGLASMTFSSNTNLGIGIEMPVYKLDVAGTIQAYNFLASSSTRAILWQIHYASQTSFTLVNEYCEVAGTSTLKLDYSNWFESPKRGQLKYLNSATKYFNIDVSGYYRETAGSKTYEFAIFKNGSQIDRAESESGATVINSNSVFSITYGTQLVQGDIIQLYVKNLTDTTAVFVRGYFLRITPSH